VLAHRQNHFVLRQVRLLLNQTQQKIRISNDEVLPAPRFGRAAARLPKALDPDNRPAGTDLELLGRLAPRTPAFHFQPPKSEPIPIDSPILRPTRIPLIQLGAEHALVYFHDGLRIAVFGSVGQRN
jgi:hypothetical protein